MKKSLIPAAVLLSLASAAHADLTIYGLLDGSLGKAIADDQQLAPDGVTPKAKTRTNFHAGGDGGNGEGNSTSRFGLKGSSDVGSGIKANFKLESNGITSNGNVNDTFFGRAAWFGFSGGFGEVRFGKQDNVPFQSFIGLDYNGASNGISSAQYSNAGRWLLLGRQARSLQYLSPAIGPVKGQLGLQLKDDTPGAKDVGSGSITFSAAGATVAAAFQTKGTTDTTASNHEDYYGIQGEYDFGLGKVTLGYHDQKTEGKGFTAGLNFTVADINFGGLYYKETNRTKGAAYELYVNKEVLKGTYAYAEVGIADKNAEGPGGGYGKGTGFAVGLIYTF
jgi:predicted porin